MKRLIFTGLVPSLLALAGCAASGTAPTETPASVPASAAAAPAVPAKLAPEQFTAWLDEKYEEELMFSPIGLTFQGRKERNDEIDDFSYEGAMKRLAWKKATVAEMKAKFDYEALSPQDRISWDVWVYQAQEQEAGMPFYYDGFVFDQMNGTQTFVATFMINFHRVSEPSDMDAYIARLIAVERALKQAMVTANEGTKRGLRYPKFALEGVRKQARAIVTGQPFTDGKDCDLWADIKMEIANLEKAEKIDATQAQSYRDRAETALVEHIKPAYDEILAFVERELTNSPEIASGAGSQPNGAAFYAYRLASQTTTNLTAEQIHELGLSEVARIRTEMEAVMKQVKFKGDLGKFFEKVRKAKWNYYPDTDAGRQGYIDDATKAIANVKTHIPDYFNLVPKADLVVKRVEPFRERDGAAQHYFPSTPDGSRPGTYYAHLSDMTAMPKNQLEVIAYHEGIPGHHMQIAIAQELTGVPKFRTQAGFTVYAEGWALYAEKLATEMPETYRDPYSEFGRLTSEIWRAIRLVVDTGLHAKGWTEQQAIDYFMANSPEPLESVTSEVRRYIVWPGQATSYKIGMIKILELRAKAKKALGEKFDIKGFHDAVLGGGAVPLGILERQVDLWIESQS